jgi:hypothetical protein
MAANRISGHFHVPPSAPVPPKSAADSSTLPMPAGFVFFPVQLSGLSAWQQEVYRLAYERAKAALQVPRHHRQLFCVWN